MSRRTLVIAARTVLVMLLVAAAALVVLGLVSLLLTDPPEVDGWLRAIFGRVFGVVAIVLAVVLGAPAGAGLWAMAGATSEGAEPALAPWARRVAVGIAVAVTGITAIVLLTRGVAPAVLDLGLLALVAMLTLGLAGAVAFSPHRGRAALSGIALVLVAAGTLWILVTAFAGRPG